MKQGNDGKSLGNMREVNDGKPLEGMKRNNRKSLEDIKQGNDGKSSEGMKKGTITLAAGEWIVRGDEQQSRHELELV